MPAYNVESFIEAAVESVLSQKWKNWELIIVDNGSIDGTLEKISKYQSEERILILIEEKRGVSFARNRGLKSMSGDYFCFLDADDVFTKESLSSRLEIFFSDRSLSFVDGKVLYVDEDLIPVGMSFIPSFVGDPFPLLLRLDRRCLFGPSWMIKRDLTEFYRFQTDMTHAEDLFFYLTIAKTKKYSYTDRTILKYRQRKNSAMSNLRGLENGYIKLLEKVNTNFPKENTAYLKFRIIRIMFLSWLFDGKDLLNAMFSVFRILRMV